MIFPWLLVLFIGMPLLELLILLKINEVMGFASTLALVIFTGALGASLARLQGFQVLMNIRKEMADGHMPAPYLMDGLMILIAGIVLITPGLITDIAGFLLLIPLCRQWLKKWLGAKIKSKIQQGTIDVSFRE